MDKAVLEKMLKMMDLESDTDAVMALRAVRGLLKDEGITLSHAVLYALQNIDHVRALCTSKTIDVSSETGVSKGFEVKGMPQCCVPRAGCIEIIPPSSHEGTIIALTGVAEQFAQLIADHLKDAMVAAVINKSKFKLKLRDVVDKHGGIVETVLEAQYDRAGMSPIAVWANVRGEVAALAAVLRKTLAVILPELLIIS